MSTDPKPTCGAVDGDFIKKASEHESDLPDVRQLELRRTVFVSVIGVLLVCLLALLANQLKQAIIANKNIGSELANTVSSTQAGLAKKPMRYEATINNWKRHRSSETKPTEIATKMPRE